MSEENRPKNIAFWCIVFAVFLLTRLPAMSHYLSIDNVNLAFALENFDPRIHQPQPPGYPLFVLFTRILNVLFHDAEKTFALTSILVSALCLPLAYALGRRMFNSFVGRAAVFLLLVSPPFWYGTLEGPLRPCLALFSLLTAYCAWRCWQGETSFMIWGALALGIGSGFRPDLGVYLFPVWLLSAWMGTRSFGAVVRGLVVLTVVVLSWLGGMAYAVGGLRELYNLNIEYVVSQSRGESVVMGAAQSGWIRQMSRLVVWNGTIVLASLVAIPLAFQHRKRLAAGPGALMFMVAWLVPGFAFQALIHVADPGHTLFSIPAMCLVAAFLIHSASHYSDSARDALLAASLIFNMTVFLSFYPLPAAAEPAGGLHSLKNAFVFASFETSIGELRYMESAATQTMAELKEVTKTDRPLVIVTSDIDVENWFMNWRIARYYMPNIEMWVVADQETPRRVEHIKRDKTLSTGVGIPVPLPVGSRVIWLIEKDGPFHRALKQAQPNLAGGNVLPYTDVDSGAQPFRVMDVAFTPQSF